MKLSTLLPVVLVAVCAATYVRNAAASWTTNGSAVSPSDSAQQVPVLIGDRAGGAYVLWPDRRSGAYVTFAQHLAADGTVTPGWPAIGLALPSQDFPGDRGHIVAALDSSGALFVADDGEYGESDFANIVIHHLEPSGTTAPGWPLRGIGLSGAPDGREAGACCQDVLPAIATTHAGGIASSWTYRDRFNNMARAARLDAQGAPPPGWRGNGEYISGGTSGAGEFPTLICLDGGDGLFVSWIDRGNGGRIALRHLAADGSEIGAAGFASFMTFGQKDHGMIPDGSGGVILAWEDSRNGSFKQVYALRLLANFSVAPGWPQTGLVISPFPTQSGIYRGPVLGTPIFYSSVLPDGDGGAFITWTDYRDSTGTSDGDIYAQHLRGDGSLAPGWPANGLPICAAAGNQQLPAITRDPSGGVVITWQDRRTGSSLDIFAQRVSGMGSIAQGWPVNGLAICDAPGDQGGPSAVCDATGNTIFAWIDSRSGVPNVFATQVPADQPVAVLASLASAETTPRSARLTWFVGFPSGGMVTIDRRTERSDWSRIASLAIEPSGRCMYEDRTVAPGERYGYRLGVGGSAGEPSYVENWVAIPKAAALAFEGALSNPISRGGMAVSFTLPSAGSGTIDVLDITGRRILGREFSNLGAGSHQMNVDGTGSLANGLYLIRLTYEGRSITRRVGVIR